MLQEFLKNPENYYDKNTPWSFIAKNYMSFDLGDLTLVVETNSLELNKL